MSQNSTPQIPHDSIGQNQINSKEVDSKDNLSKQPKIKRIKTRATIVEQKEDEDLKFQEIRNSDFKQQRFLAWRPVPTIKSIIIVFSLFGAVYIILGIVLIIYSNKVKSIELKYDDCENNPCLRNITIDEDIDGPIFIYYQLDGFFQNSRRYVKSKNIAQLQGDNISDTDDCAPALYNKEMDFGQDKKAIDNQTSLDSNSIAVPCGLMAKTFFNDTYKFKFNNGSEILVNEDNITYPKDKELFKKNSENISKQWIDLTNEHFIVWMRPSGLPNPRKLWGKIENNLKKGDLIDVTISNNYNVSYYKGAKKLILSNATKFGGKNYFLGIAYIIVGGLSLLCAIIFPIGYKVQSSKEKMS